MKTIYINMQGSFGIETVDEFPYNNKTERIEAKRCLDEYKLSDQFNSYYFSQRSTKEWRSK